jgi:peptide/nickel transport system substrate-binding protein
MQNRFGLKDLVLIALMLVVLVMLLLQMVQNDRSAKDVGDRLAALQRLETQVGQLSSTVGGLGGQVRALSDRVERGVTVSGTAAASGSAAPVRSAGGGAGSGGRDAAWAREGVEIQWQAPLGFATEPSKQPGFAEGGELTEIWEAQTKIITPYIATDTYSRRVEDLVMEGLGKYDPKTLKHVGVLAEAWQVDPKGLWLRARLREGVRFADGTPITAEDFRFTFHDFVMNEQIEAERARSILRDSIAKVEAIDARTVEFTFKEALFSNVANALSLSVMPKAFYSQFSPAQINRGTGIMVGSGPYRVRGVSLETQWTPPDDIVLERNEQYWGPRPALATIRIKGISEELARVNTFAKGEAQIVTPTAVQFVAKREGAKGSEADEIWRDRTRYLEWVNMRSGYSFIAWNCGERNGKLTPFADRRVRLAMTHGLDREKMIRDIWRGIGEVAKGNMPLASPGSNKSIKPWPFDPSRARALLKESGWEDRDGDGKLEDKFGSPFKFQYTYASGGEIAERVARFVKDSYQALGIEVEIKPVEWAVYTDLLKTRDFDAITLGWGASAPESDPIQIFHSKSIKDQGDNFAQWNSPEADRLIDAGRRELDFDRRMEIWSQLEAVIHQEQPYTFVRVPPWLRFVSTDMGNVVMYPKGLEPTEYFRGAGATPTPAN